MSEDPEIPELRMITNQGPGGPVGPDPNRDCPRARIVFQTFGMSRWRPKGKRTVVMRRTSDPSSSPRPGAYEDLNVELMERTDADGIILIVIHGNRGDGFQATFRAGSPHSDVDAPMFLRRAADQIEAGRLTTLNKLS